MQEVALFFSTVSESIFNSEFVWSDYNQNQWKYFCSIENGPEGGLAVFSFERNGDYPNSSDPYHKLKGLGVGKPLGRFPFSIWCAGESRFTKGFIQKLEYSGYTTDTTLTLD